MTTYRDATKTVIVALIWTQAGVRGSNCKESRSSQYLDIIYKHTVSFGISVRNTSFSCIRGARIEWFPR
jgi:hypothetical protein